MVIALIFEFLLTILLHNQPFHSAEENGGVSIVGVPYAPWWCATVWQWTGSSTTHFGAALDIIITKERSLINNNNNIYTRRLNEEDRYVTFHAEQLLVSFYLLSTTCRGGSSSRSIGWVSYLVTTHGRIDIWDHSLLIIMWEFNHSMRPLGISLLERRYYGVSHTMLGPPLFVYTFTRHGEIQSSLNNSIVVALFLMPLISTLDYFCEDPNIYKYPTGAIWL